MLKIALINPGKVDGRFVHREDKHVSIHDHPILPYSCANILGLVKDKIRDCEIRYFDATIDNISNNELNIKVINFKPDLIISILSWITIPQDRICAELPIPTISMIFQQYVPQNEAAKIYKLKCDYIIKNELEGPLIEGIKQFQSKGKIEDVRGFLIKNSDGSFRDTGNSKMFPVEELWSFPDFEKARFKDYIELQAQNINGPVSFNLNTSKGCAFKCAFCGQANSGTKLRSQSPKFVVDQIEYLQKKYHLNNFQFIDNIFSGFRKRAKEICKEIISRNLNVSFIVNDRVRYYDQELIDLLKKAGCTTVKVGVETVDKKTQKYINKEVDNSKELEKMREIKKSGIKLSFYMTPGIPGEDLKTLWLNAKFIVDSNADYYSVGPLWVMPGSPLYQRLKLENKIIIKEWSKYRNLKSLTFINDTYKDLSSIKRAIFYMYLFIILLRFFKRFKIRKKEIYKAFPNLKYSIFKKIFIRLPIIEK